MSGDTTPAGHGDVCFQVTPPEEVRTRTVSFIDAYTTAADAEGLVINLSGGLDSTVTAALAVEALGADAVYGLVLPNSKIGGESAQHAEAVAELLGIDYERIHLQPLLAHLGDLTPERVDLHGSPLVRGNLIARMRMTFAYLVANDAGALVAGTANRSELLLGYFTKYGDGGVDLLPLGDRYKTEIRRLADELNVPEFVAEKPPTAGFWPGQTDESDLGVSYEVIDAVLYRYVEANLDVSRICRELDADSAAVECVINHYEETAHKRSFPPTPSEFE